VLVAHLLQRTLQLGALPLVSVIIPAYCAAEFLARTLDSVIGQTYRNIEVFVVDDGSTDETFQIAEDYSRRDPRVKVLRQNNAGAAAARNLAISHAAGEFIAPIDADDIWLPENLQKQVAAMRSGDSSVGVVYSWSFDIGTCDTPLGSFHAYDIDGSVYTTLICHNFIGNASATLLRTSCVKEVGCYTDDFWRSGVHGCEDWELYLRLAAKYKFKVVPEFLVGYRKNPKSMSQGCESMAASHAALLNRIEEFVHVPKAVRLLSTSSFYIHLAHQCTNTGRARESFQWLRKACAAEWLTPLLRLEVYSLVIKNLCAGRAITAQGKVKDVTLHSMVRDGSLHRRLCLGRILHRTMQFAFERKHVRLPLQLESSGLAVP
jgi:glycosyltransferase involved in cell wall biosynthesis